MQKLYEVPDLEIVSETFGNGLKAFICPNNHSDTVNIQLWTKNGSIHEDEHLGCGLSHFLEHMIFQGSKKYPDNMISEVAAENGGEINAYTSFGNTVYYVDILSRNAEKGIDILCDAVTSPIFPEEAFANEKDVILRERDMVSDNPDRMLNERLFQTMFTENPVRHPVIGYKDKISEVSREMMQEFHMARYTPERSFFVICGKIDPENAIGWIGEKMQSWKNTRLHNSPLPLEPESQSMKTAVFRFKDPLARTAIAYHVPCAYGKDAPALDLLSFMLGTNRSSRLVARIQNEKELAMDIHSMNYSSYFCGIFACFATCEASKLDELKSKTFAEIEKLKKNEPPSREEIDRTRRCIMTDFLKGLKHNTFTSSLIGNSFLNYGNPDYVINYQKEILRTSSEQIRHVAEKYLDSRNCTIVDQLPEDASVKTTVRKISPNAETIPEMIKLSGNQRLVLLHDDRLPLLDLSMVFPGGVYNEDNDKSGISCLLSNILTSGCKDLDEEAIDMIMDDNAIDLDLNSGSNSLMLSMCFHSASTGKALELLRKILSTPKFPEKQFIREKENLFNTIESRNLSPRKAAENLFRKTLYGKHPYSRPLCGEPESVRKLDRAMLKDFYFRNCLVPSRTVIGIAGDFKKKKIIREIESIVASIPWSETECRSPGHPKFPDCEIRKSTTVPREQAVVMRGFPLCETMSPDTYPLKLLSKALNGLTSRLFQRVRNDSGLAYYTGFSSDFGIHPGYGAFVAGTHPDKTEDVIRLFEDERLNLLKDGIDEDEFRRARACIERDISEMKSDSGSMIRFSASSEYVGKGFMEPFLISDRYSHISIEDVHSSIKKYFQAKGIVTVLAGPKERN